MCVIILVPILTAHINLISKLKLYLVFFFQKCEEPTSVTSDDEGSKRSVRFTTDNLIAELEILNSDRDVCDGQAHNESTDENNIIVPEIMPMKKHSSLFHNALRPNSAVRQLFPIATTTTTTTTPTAITTTPTTISTAITNPSVPLTHEALRAFEEAKRTHITTTNVIHSDSETDTIRRTIERNALRRSLIKYEPK